MTSARFENEAAAARFDLAVKDDRTLLVVPRQTAIADPASVAGSYTSRVIVNVCGAEYVTEGSLKLTVKKSTPKLKATALTFNSFYTEQSQPILVTGGTVTRISRNTAKDTGKTTALPAWLTLSEGVLTLAEDTPATASGKAEVLVETAEWAVPAAVSVSVKLTRKTPRLKLSAATVTIPAYSNSDDNGFLGGEAAVRLLCKNKKDTLKSLNVSWIEVPQGWFQLSGENLHQNDGWFPVRPDRGVTPVDGKIVLKVHFHDTDSVVELPLTVKTQHTPLTIRTYFSGTAYKLNSTVQDGFSVPWYVGPQYIDLSGYELTWQILDKSGNNVLERDMFDTRVLDDGRLGVWTRPGVVKPGTYRLCMDLQDKQTKERKTEQSAVIPFTVLPEKEKPVIPIKVSNTIDLAFPDPGTGITFMKKNYFLMNFENFNNLVPTFTNAKGQDVTDQFTFERDNSSGTWVIRPRGEVAVGSYKLAFDVIVDSSSPNGTVHCSAKFTVKRTAIKLKLSKTSLSLNKTVGDWTVVDVTCLTKGYDLARPEISLMDSTGKASAEGQLSLDYSSGKLTVATNDKTRYGETYKVVARATAKDPAVTLTVKIPSLYQSTVSASLKAKGAIDVIRDSTSVTVTPTYKNYAGKAEIGAAITVLRSEDGKTYTTDVTSDFRITANENGSFTIARKPGISLDATRKYRVMLSFPEVPDSKSAYTALSVKAGKASVKAGSTAILYSTDRNSRGEFLLTSKDKTLNPISKVEFKNAGDAAIYEIFSYGDGSFAIGFRNAAVAAKVKSGSIPLNVFFEGSASEKPGTNVTLKLQIR